ncbi:MAG TPA: protease pro-enzyme activation domain-containing protein [Polyangiaceae bacterium]|nr:protease pro-enzyme activation domain-containing protein [Polyangiaceae bacterium]
MIKGTIATVLTLFCVACSSSHQAKDVGDGFRQQKSALTGAQPDQSVIPASESRLAAGANATCMILGNGALKCWGSNAHYQLAVGPGGDRGHDAAMMGSMLPAVPLGAGLSARSVAVSNYQTCALLSDSTIECWGTNENGALGIDQGSITIGDNWGEPGNQALRVNLGQKVRSLVAGADSFFCAIVANGDVRCWGRNQAGQLGVGDVTDRGTDSTNSVENTPKVALGGHIATAIAAGGDHACAILETGGVRCWGANDSGQLGTGDATPRGDNAQDVISDVPLGTGRSAVAIVAGRAHTCVRLDDGSVKCWGDNSFGQLGIGDTTVHGVNGTSALGDGLPAVDFGTKRTARSIVAGADHTCAILDTGELKCWGKNSVGQLGIESTTNQGDTPNTVGDPNATAGVHGMQSISLGTLRTPRAVVAGGDHTCAWLDDGSVKCWGSNASGESGLGYPPAVAHGNVTGTMGDNLPAVPLSRWISNTGNYHSCAVLDDGSVKCWGYNTDGQLGTGDTQLYGGPAGTMGAALPAVELRPGRTALMVGTGRAHSCALLDDRTVQCWGNNSFGQLVVGNAAPTGCASASTPSAGRDCWAALPPITFGTAKVVSLAVGGDTNCAILDDNTLRCWGNNAHYELANGGTRNIGTAQSDINNIPAIPLSGLTPRAVTIGTMHVCVLFSNNDVKCWGQNQFAQLGIGSVATYQKTVPSGYVVTLDPVADVVKSIFAGWNNTCAILASGAVKCWGDNRVGELGIDNKAYVGFDSTKATAVVNLPAALSIGVGYNHMCALLATGAVRCWGYNGYGQAGPVNVGDQNGNIGDSSGEMEAMATEGDFSLGTGASPVGVDASTYKSCALLADGRIKCWGYNIYGQLGLGTGTYNNYLGYNTADMGNNLATTKLGGNRSALAVASGDNFNCAILENGPVKCWGKNDAGQLGVGDTNPRGTTTAQTGASLPAVLLGSGRSARMLAAGARHACALLDNGAIKCWGANDSGQLGLGDTANRGSAANQMGDNLSAVKLGTGRTAIAVTAGTAHTCALFEEGDVMCWGANAQGQLGVGNSTPIGATANQMGDALVDVRFGKGLKPLAIAAERNHTCVLLNTGSVKCWGENTNGDLGIDQPGNWGDQPNELSDGLPFVDLGTITPGSTPPGPPNVAILVAPSCAVLQDGSLKCWGDNSSGQLGLGTTDQHGVTPGDMGDGLLPITFGGAHVLGLAARDDHKCVVLDDGTVKCWGNNASGQLGLDAPDPNRSSPPATTVPLGAGRTARRAAVGVSHSCAVLDDGTVKCWGYNADGELGIGATSPLGASPNDVLQPVNFGDTDIWNGAAPSTTGQCANVNDGDSCTTDVCDPATGVTHTRMCNAQCPCSGADGICTSDSDCASGDVCGVNNGTFFGHQRSDRLCWGSTCSQNALESCGTPTSSCGTRCVAAKPCGNDVDCGTGEVCGQQNGASFSSSAKNVCWPAACNSQPRQTGCGTVFSPCGLCPGPAINTFVAYAQQSITLGIGDRSVGGDIGVASVAAGSAVQLTVGAQDHLDTTATLIAPSVSLGAQCVVGNIESNEVSNGGSTSTGTYPSGLPPLPLALPSTPGTANITVPQGQTQTLSAGNFGVLTVNGTVQLNPGVYSFASVALADGAQLLAQPGEKTDVRVAGTFTTGNGAQVSPAAGQHANTLSISVSGGDGSNGSPTVSLGANTNITAVLNAPRGTLSLTTGVNATGAYSAFAIVAGDNVTLTYDSGLPKASQQPAGQQKLSGYVTPDMAAAPLVGPVPRSTVVYLSVSLPVRTPAPSDFPTLTDFVTQVSNPTNARFRQFLTDQQYTTYYRPTNDDYNRLKSFAQAAGLSLLNTYDDQELLDLSAPVTQIEPMLHAQMNLYQRPDGTTFYGLDRDPSIDLDPITPVLHISGTNNFRLPTHAATGIPGQNWLANDFRNAYVPVCTSGPTALDGSGQSIAVLIFEDFDQGDLFEYDQTSGIPDPPDLTLLDGVTWIPTGLLTNFTHITPAINAVEAPLDIEMAHSLAPEANIITYLAPNQTGGGIFHNFFVDAFHGAAHPPNSLPRSNQVSTSWMTDRDDDIQQAVNEMAAFGQSFVMASGDSGSATGIPDDIRADDNVTLVGGTTLSFTPGMLPSEATYNDTKNSFSGGSGYMGSYTKCVGCPNYPGVAVPDYQKDLWLFGAASVQWRSYPDISMVATNIDEFITTNAGIGATTPGAGTSASAPLFAGFLALVNQRGQRDYHLPPVGFINPSLYAIGKTRNLAAASFNDVQMGTTPHYIQPNSGYANNGDPLPAGGFAAIPGYDMATGWGSPTCTLVNQLASQTPTVPVAPPPDPGSALPSFASFDLVDSCAIHTATGTLQCWGENDDGQNGTDANVVDTDEHLTPVCPAVYQDGIGVTSTASGERFTCALKADGSVWCWGDNSFGQLGPAAINSPSVPVQNTGLATDDPPIQLAAGGATVCALTRAGNVWCWGNNAEGQLGNNRTNTIPNPQPWQVPMGPALQVTVSPFKGSYVCALLASGGVDCWGAGYLGNGVFSSSLTPVAVQTAFDLGNLSHVVFISAGYTHACAIVAQSNDSPGDGLWCWGENALGQLGQGTTSNMPALVATPASAVTTSVTAVACGGYFTCVMWPGGGAVQCFGDEAGGRLGDGIDTTDDQPQVTPIAIDLAPAAAIASGFNRACAQLQNGIIRCWGAGPAGDGTTAQADAPTSISTSRCF